MLIDQIEIRVTDPDAATQFYETALAPLGVACVLSIPADRSASGRPRRGLDAMVIRASGFHAGETCSVDYTSPLLRLTGHRSMPFMRPLVGGRDNGPPGIRTRYHPN